MSTLRYIKGRIKNRRDTKESLSDNNPLLYDGEICIESDTNKFKFGDGVTRWNDLPYYSGGTPTGTILPFGGIEPPDEFLICDGSQVSRSEYADLFNVIGTRFGNGDGHSTFTLPDLIERTTWGVESSNVGLTRDAGLPNITGHYNARDLNDSDPYNWDVETAGALWYDESARVWSTPKDNGGDEAQHGISFDASRSNPIYGNSDTVQPPAVCVLYIIKT